MTAISIACVPLAKVVNDCTNNAAIGRQAQM